MLLQPRLLLLPFLLLHTLLPFLLLDLAQAQSTTTTRADASTMDFLKDSAREVMHCPSAFLGCIFSAPCRATMACAAHCVTGTNMNLTCFMPCTQGNDQRAFTTFSKCVMEERDPLDPGVDDLPNEGKCLDVQSLVVPDWQVSSLEGEWFVVAGASTLEGYDCQKNRVSVYNSTHWQIDEYFQGNITGLGFKWAQTRQMITPLPSPSSSSSDQKEEEGREGGRTGGQGRMGWRPADGASGYEATYFVLAAADTYTIFYYCAPLFPTPFFWSSFIMYSRSPEPPKEGMKKLQGLLKKFEWDQPLKVVNHQDCDYKIAPLTPAPGSSPSSASSSYFLPPSLASYLPASLFSYASSPSSSSNDKKASEL